MAPDGPRQIALDFTHVPAFAREDLVVSPANRDAVALIERWPSWSSPFAILVGPAGSGKSHLGAIWRERSEATRADAARLMELAGLSPWPPILIDDADGRDLDENGLFHALNAARAAGAGVLLTARTQPLNWGVELPDLASRLQAATTVELRAPDDLLLSGVITKLFADRQIAIEPAVVLFLVRRMERSLPAAAAAVEALDRLALERQTRITRSLAAELFEAEPRQLDLY